LPKNSENRRKGKIHPCGNIYEPKDETAEALEFRCEF
jgi:hypothetical protein